MLKITREEFLGLGDDKMSKAKACDRCGKIYPVNHDYTDMTMIVKYGYDYGKDTIFTTIDLCPVCADAFEEFRINRMKNTDHNEEVY